MKNDHNGLIPRDFWLTEAERLAIIEYFRRYNRSLCYMMMDADIVAVPSSYISRIYGQMET